MGVAKKIAGVTIGAIVLIVFLLVLSDLLNTSSNVTLQPQVKFTDYSASSGYEWGSWNGG